MIRSPSTIDRWQGGTLRSYLFAAVTLLALLSLCVTPTLAQDPTTTCQTSADCAGNYNDRVCLNGICTSYCSSYTDCNDERLPYCVAGACAATLPADVPKGGSCGVSLACGFGGWLFGEKETDRIHLLRSLVSDSSLCLAGESRALPQVTLGHVLLVSRPLGIRKFQSRNADPCPLSGFLRPGSHLRRSRRDLQRRCEQSLRLVQWPGEQDALALEQSLTTLTQYFSLPQPCQNGHCPLPSGASCSISSIYSYVQCSGTQQCQYVVFQGTLCAGPGAYCDANFPCDSQYTCDSSSKTCQVPPQPTGALSSTRRKRRALQELRKAPEQRWMTDGQIALTLGCQGGQVACEIGEGRVSVSWLVDSVSLSAWLTRHSTVRLTRRRPRILRRMSAVRDRLHGDSRRGRCAVLEWSLLDRWVEQFLRVRQASLTDVGAAVQIRVSRDSD